MTRRQPADSISEATWAIYSWTLGFAIPRDTWDHSPWRGTQETGRELVHTRARPFSSSVHSGGLAGAHRSLALGQTTTLGRTTGSRWSVDAWVKRQCLVSDSSTDHGVVLPITPLSSTVKLQTLASFTRIACQGWPNSAMFPMNTRMV